ncbi:MAG: glycoside hydrolase family 127 protein [Planctomycetota bacterium]|nr:glycoside hydrolase family 127 protein [Planctomycetota bacterium]
MPLIQPIADRISGTRFDLGGVIGDYVRNVTAQWIAIAPHANPGMLEMFRDRDRKPYREMVPWAGEFAGKYLTGAVQVLRVTGDKNLRAYLENFVAELLPLQAEDGYFGPWPEFGRATNRVEYSPGRVHWTWDTWGHYHMMLGLMLWHEETGDRKAFAAVRRIADMLCEKYLGQKSPRLSETNSTEMNLAPIHTLGILHAKTGEPKYLALAKQICEEFAAKDAEGKFLTGDYLEGPLKGQEFFELPKPRWESLHPIMGMAELHYASGDARFRTAYERIWRSIARGDRHNNGGFSSGEQATGNPFDPAAIETCCTIAWMALSVEMLRLTGEPAAADELELSLFNSVTGMHSPSGRWATYNTPMGGVRIASAQAIVFQAREGTPELNCCSVNSVRGFGMLSDWAAMRAGEAALNLNFYGPGSITLPLATPANKKLSVTLKQTTEYPFAPKVTIAVSPSAAAEFTLNLRIPRWSRRTTVKVNGKAVKGAQAGSYLALARKWKKGDKIEVGFDFALHTWTGRWDAEGKVSLYRGPILLAYDRRYNEMDPDQLPALALDKLKARKVEWKHWLPPRLLLEFTAADGRKVRLCDFGSAGQGGTPYLSWLPYAGKATERSESFEPFGPSAEEYLVLELLRYRSYHRGFLRDQGLLRQQFPYVNKQGVLGYARRLRERFPAFLALVKEMRDYVAAHPGAEVIGRALERFDAKNEELTPAFAAMIDGLETSVRDEFGIPIASGDFECSSLLPGVELIKPVTLPAPGTHFERVATVSDEKFCDIRAFHHGAQGLLYVRTTITMPEAGEGTLVYGADGPVKAWLNGQEVGMHPEATNPAKADSFRAKVAWRKGDNEVVLALLTNQGRAWGVFVGRL